MNPYSIENLACTAISEKVKPHSALRHEAKPARITLYLENLDPTPSPETEPGFGGLEVISILSCSGIYDSAVKSNGFGERRLTDRTDIGSVWKVRMPCVRDFRKSLRDSDSIIEGGKRRRSEI
jgi:hypothetical protein